MVNLLSQPPAGFADDEISRSMRPSIMVQGQFEYWTTSERGIAFKSGTPKETWLAVVGQITEMFENGYRLHSRAMFMLGDALAFGEETYGEEFSQAISDTRKFIQLSAHTLQNVASVCRKIPSSLRRELLSFEHHKAVQGLPLDEQDELLRQSEENNLTVSALKGIIRERHPKTKRGQDRKEKNESKAAFTIENTTDAKKAATALSNWMTANEDKVNDTWKPLLEHFYKLFRRRWMSGHKR